MKLQDPAQEERRQTRLAWWFMAGAFLMVLFVFVFAFLVDSSPPKNDGWMMPQRTAAGGPDNPLILYCRELKKPESTQAVSRYNNDSEIVRKDEKAIQKFVSENKGLLDRWDPRLYSVGKNGTDEGGDFQRPLT